MAARVAILGAGVVGLAVARSLARRGASVVVVDAAREAREASWAAAGILGVGSEHGTKDPLFRLCLDAFDRWPSTAHDLERETGIALRLRREGTLVLARDDDERAALEARAAFHRDHGIPSRVLDPAEAAAREPRASRAIRAALWIPEARLDNRALRQALVASCRALGVGLLEGVAVSRIDERAGRVRGVATSGGPLDADAVVLSAGAWTDALATTTGLSLPTVPVKGQMLRLAAPDGFLSHVVERGAHYVVPRAGSGLVVGTTSEQSGWDRSLDASTLASVEAAARDLVPDAASLPRAEALSGFRPRLADGLPALGPVRARAGLFVATGHYRNGILLCARTGDLVARAVLGDVDPALAPFSPDRFAS